VASRSEFLPQNRREWLLAIGKRLRAEYAAVAEPVPERLAALVAQLEEPAPVVPLNPRHAVWDTGNAPPADAGVEPAASVAQPPAPSGCGDHGKTARPELR
jgi:Anti-sigma factor NepR